MTYYLSVDRSDLCMLMLVFFFFKHKKAYEMRISDWSSDVCSSDLSAGIGFAAGHHAQVWTADYLGQFIGEQVIRWSDGIVGNGADKFALVLPLTLLAQDAHGLHHAAIVELRPLGLRHLNGQGSEIGRAHV